MSSGAEGVSQRGTAVLALRSLLGAAWFALNFFLVIPGLVLWLAGTDFWPPPGILRWLGVAVIGAAHVLLYVQVRAFVIRGRGTHVPIDPPRALVEDGLYAYVRNPMYSIYVIIVLGEAILYHSPELAGYAALLWGVAHGYIVGVEEKVLRRRFGEAYEAYASRAGRWLPRRRPGS